MNVFEQVREIVAKQLSVNPSVIQRETTFSEVEADSLDVVEVIMSIENVFNIELPDEEVENFENVGALADFVKKIAYPETSV